ncbi:MAG: hypothetical protein F6K42_13050 [Leptolyngbya sp. SIO1D8]|nr:hypothetical protein [Leptolyngbya sp. SIO1D8]
MYIKRNISINILMRYAWRIILFSSLWTIAVFSAHYYVGWHFIDIPFQPITVTGIAVAFLIGFKNNQSYDRFWEGRKIWGSIVNYSRTWANQVLNVVTADNGQDLSEPELKHHHKILIHRHIAWLHALRLQLRRPTSFSLKENKLVEELLSRHNDNEKICEVIKPYLSKAENDDLKRRKNIATHIVKLQGNHLRKLKEEHQLMDGFDFMMMMKCLEEFYNFQGKCERIKNTPFPRQYAFFSRVFTNIFVMLLPLGLLNVFENEIVKNQFPLPEWYIYLMIPLSVLISWIFLTWEVVGGNSEDPFENKPNDVPMTALTRTIEIDLRDMLDESNLPKKTQPKDNILY